ncbi:MAG: DegV family protein [Ruthenibacterium sp.]
MIRILTDSTADISVVEAKELGVSVVPLQVNFGDEHFQDGIDLSMERFYDMLAVAEKLPTTSQPSPDLFLAHFNEAKAAGDTLICILLSAALSGTCQSAEIAKEEAEYDNIYIIDSKSASLGLDLMIRRALHDVQTGMSAAEIVIDLEAAREDLRLYAVPDTLKYLQKGGRLSAATAFAGGLLGIKPVLAVVDGKLAMADKARGLPGAYVAIFKLIDKAGGIDENWPVNIGYTGKRHGVEPFTRYVMNNLHLQKPHVAPIGTVIGTHGGPGACAIAFFAKEEKAE